MRVEGRRIYIVTGSGTSGTQTINVCFPANNRGTYERVYRFTPRCTNSNDEMESLLEQQQIATLEDLYEWLVKKGARRDTKRESNCDGKKEPPTEYSVSDVVEGVVRRCFVDFGITAQGQNYKSGTIGSSLTNFSACPRVVPKQC